MMKIKHMLILAFLVIPLAGSAQNNEQEKQKAENINDMLSDKKQKLSMTLEDLNFGGKNYHNMQPKNMWLTWWGDQLVQTDVEECYLIDVKTGKKKLLFTLDDINKWADSNEDENRYV
ncbi:MAG: hypothetical protein J6P41_04325, partial [Prevotella sp.]|nr:hypothetical protein [Prevotella sp.]